MPPPLSVGLGSGEIEIILRPSAMNEVFRGTSGPVMRYILQRGERVKNSARQKVGVSQPDPIPRRVPKVPGTLRNSIVKRAATIDGEPACLVGVFAGPALKYAGFHHEGTHAHIIRPRRAPMLVFWSGKVVRAKIVHHPGTRPNRFLTDALREEMR